MYHERFVYQNSRIKTEKELRRLAKRRRRKHLALAMERSYYASLIRLHRVGESDATQTARLFFYLRHLQRQVQRAVMLGHHARKDSQSSRPGQALRGSRELHAWGDSNLCMRRKGSQLTLSTEHRAAPSRDHIPLQLTESGSVVAVKVVDRAPVEPEARLTPTQPVRQVLA